MSESNGDKPRHDSTQLDSRQSEPEQRDSKQRNSAAGVASQRSGVLRLLDREPPVDYRDEWTKRIAQAESEVEADTDSVVIFRIGTEWLALPTQIVDEITESQTLHAIPHRSGGTLLGLVCVRGELLLCAALGAVLGIEQAARKKARMLVTQGRLIIVKEGENPLALPVDEVYGVHRFHARELKDVPDTLVKVSKTYTRGLLPWNGKNVAYLDAQLLFYTLDKSFS